VRCGPELTSALCSHGWVIPIWRPRCGTCVHSVTPPCARRSKPSGAESLEIEGADARSLHTAGWGKEHCLFAGGSLIPRCRASENLKQDDDPKIRAYRSLCVCSPCHYHAAICGLKTCCVPYDSLDANHYAAGYLFVAMLVRSAFSRSTGK